jgi:MEMO1 family protein
MAKKPIFILAFYAVLLIFLAGLFCLSFDFFHHHRPGGNKPRPEFILRTFYEGPTVYDSFYQFGAAQIIAPDKEVAAGIIPHHLIVGDKIAAFFLGLEKEKYDTVVLLSPDHFGLTGAKIIVSGASWQTPYGLLENDEILARKISSSTGFVYLLDGRLAREHGVNYETPFIKKSFPNAKLVAMLIKKDAKKEDLDKLAAAILANSGGRKILVLGSVDFSHDLSAAQADEEDKISNKIIGSFNLAEYAKIKADCPAAVYAVMKYADLVGAREPKLLWNTNSGRLIKKPAGPTVSHNFYYFFQPQF